MDKHIRISGSERKDYPNARKLDRMNNNEQISVMVIVRRFSNITNPSAETNECQFSNEHYTRETFSQDYYIHQDDIKILEEFVKDYELVLEEIMSSAGIAILSGTIEKLKIAFNVEISDYEHPQFSFRGRNGYVHVPERLAEIILGVLGLDNRPQTKPHFRVLKETEINMRKNQVKSSFTPLEIASLYNFPNNIDCTNQCIGIIELGGGYRQEDMEQYFSTLGVPAPVITDIEVDGTKNTPNGDANGADGEVALDIEIAASVAPNAKIAVYFAPNSDKGFLQAINTAIHDKVNKPSVISISWGGPESFWTKQAILAMNRAFKDAAALGITILCASGDNGSSDGVEDGLDHVDFPASSPFVIACGGTRLEASDGKIIQEIVWNELNNGATGGGISTVFKLPKWQNEIDLLRSKNPTRRGVPDVAGNADPLTGYQILVNGKKYIFGGTSAVAPLYAGLIANINQQLGQAIGFANPLLYQDLFSDNGFRDITSGNNDTVGNGSYEAGIGWDACTGLGSIDGMKLLNTLKPYYSSNIIMK